MRANKKEKELSEIDKLEGESEREREREGQGERGREREREGEKKERKKERWTIIYKKKSVTKRRTHRSFAYILAES